MNPRYQSYLETTDHLTNWGFMQFISQMKKLYCGDVINGHIEDHDEFTNFIKKTIRNNK